MKIILVAFLLSIAGPTAVHGNLRCSGGPSCQCECDDYGPVVWVDSATAPDGSCEKPDITCTGGECIEIICYKCGLHLECLVGASPQGAAICTNWHLWKYDIRDDARPGADCNQGFTGNGIPECVAVEPDCPPITQQTTCPMSGQGLSNARIYELCPPDDTGDCGTCMAHEDTVRFCEEGEAGDVFEIKYVDELRCSVGSNNCVQGADIWDYTYEGCVGDKCEGDYVECDCVDV